ncbi:hypothetical protein BGZ91_006977, partial [Linnemannia elongata]
QTMSIYPRRRCVNMHVMQHVHNVSIPNSMKELETIGGKYKIWFEKAHTVENGIKPALEL